MLDVAGDGVASGCTRHRDPGSTRGMDHAHERSSTTGRDISRSSASNLPIDTATPLTTRLARYAIRLFHASEQCRLSTCCRKSIQPGHVVTATTAAQAGSVSRICHRPRRGMLDGACEDIVCRSDGSDATPRCGDGVRDQPRSGPDTTGDLAIESARESAVSPFAASPVEGSASSECEPTRARLCGLCPRPRGWFHSNLGFDLSGRGSSTALCTTCTGAVLPPQRNGRPDSAPTAREAFR